MMLKKTLFAAATAVLATLAAGVVHAEPAKPECIAPAKPGGGFDLTCKLAQSALQNSKLLEAPMRVTYMPGGIGAVAYNTVIANRPAEGGTIVAYSGGSFLNLAIGKFGKYTEDDVRWLAAVGADYGAIIVKADSPHQSLKDLVEATRKEPSKVVFGAGGSVGSQDWMKSALIAREAGVDPKSMRYVAFEGGGEAITALMGGHVHAYSGDASEVLGHLKGGRIKVLAIMAPERLKGELADIPTAIEQGYNVDWTITRGFYMGPKVSDADYQWWIAAFEKLQASPEFDQLRAERGLFPYDLTGAELTENVKREVARYKVLAKELGLVAQ
ncbi:MAG TPA: tripartite tricarboxylate transporter substrate binding protein [Thauera sp.]|uniref:Bug family tripartite tricarboxylate transporter substrate binding protein n=1 Tax=Thauera sp. TaxID=1905334 RepID=UPI002CDA53D9|nr:tripartite tricarboxylate transporter substrate binding protein [Thauera sp.]HRP25885.1 tripartite tricarboxylate transporter substrate binding protein [Thauera sp.]HRP66154.1 tripartite tricarboxylate transporter substrate binding protein [Thauera sp.]